MSSSGTLAASWTWGMRIFSIALEMTGRTPVTAISFSPGSMTSSGLPGIGGLLLAVHACHDTIDDGGLGAHGDEFFGHLCHGRARRLNTQATQDWVYGGCHVRQGCLAHFVGNNGAPDGLPGDSTIVAEEAGATEGAHVPSGGHPME